jgi:hypothetical protein
LRYRRFHSDNWFTRGLWIWRLWFLVIPISLIGQNSQDSLILRNPDTTRLLPVLISGGFITSSGPGSLFAGKLIVGMGLHSAMIFRKAQKSRYFTDLQLAYLMRSNAFSVAWNDTDQRIFTSFGYFLQSSFGWNINDSEGDHFAYLGPFILAKLYDTNMIRNQFTVGVMLSDDIKISTKGIPLYFLCKFYIPVLDYTEAVKNPLFISSYILNWQYSITAGWHFQKQKSGNLR